MCPSHVNHSLKHKIHQVNFFLQMPVAVHGLSGSMEVVSMDWFSGSAPTNRPVLAICYRNGLIILMKNCIEEGQLLATHNII